jgi:hypothetical protein
LTPVLSQLNLANTAINIRVPLKAGNFLADWAIITAQVPYSVELIDLESSVQLT